MAAKILEESRDKKTVELEISDKSVLQKIIYFINKADTHQSSAEKLARELTAYTSDPVYVGSIHQRIYEQING